MGTFELDKPHNPNCDRSPQIMNSPVDGVVDLCGLTIQARCLSRYSHYPPPQPQAQLLTQVVLASSSLAVALNYVAG